MSVFPRDFDYFLDEKWLFYEGNTKMCVLEVWNDFFETLGWALKKGYVWRSDRRSFRVFE